MSIDLYSIDWRFVVRKGLAAGVVVGLLCAAVWFLVTAYVTSPVVREVAHFYLLPIAVVVVFGGCFLLALRELGLE